LVSQFFFVRYPGETKLNKGLIKRFSHEEQGVRVVDQAVKSTVWWLEVIALNWPRPGTMPSQQRRKNVSEETRTGSSCSVQSQVAYELQGRHISG
jgi:hypothetical protein